VAGSTHAGEEEIVLSVYRALKARDADLVLILAPRRRERVAEVASLLTMRGVPFTLRSRIGEDAGLNEDVILVDTMGELEPLSYALPVLHGPFIDNIRHVAGPLKEAGLAHPVETPAEMQETLQKLLWAPADGERAERARALLKEYQGASRCMAEHILKLWASGNR
jgi:3-deoxy-D-manno-octulosonic-acid transferase